MGPRRKGCAYRPCPSRTGEPTSIFVLPKDPERAAIWLKACLRHDLLDKDMGRLHTNYLLCEKHFEDKYMHKGETRKCLFDQAVPTIFPHNLKQDATDKYTNVVPSLKEIRTEITSIENPFDIADVLKNLEQVLWYVVAISLMERKKMALHYLYLMKKRSFLHITYHPRRRKNED